jgi:3-oxo-5-alpha-steroid 4-dehydrogenase 1
MTLHWLWLWIGLALILLPVQFFVAAPYGRHNSNSWGPQINSKKGWVIMECVALFSFLISFVSGGEYTSVTLVIAGLFTLHYVHRSIIYPWMTRFGSKTMPLLIVLFAVIFNMINGYINGEYLGAFPDAYPIEYFGDIRFIVGLTIFVIGALINITSDYYLISLRKNEKSNIYHIPKGGLFNWISCPNHFGEILEWSGFAILAWNLPALAFAAWTASNLVPRAWHHHRWYKQKFSDYPDDRKALVPGVF